MEIDLQERQLLEKTLDSWALMACCELQKNEAYLHFSKRECEAEPPHPSEVQKTQGTSGSWGTWKTRQTSFGIFITFSASGWHFFKVFFHIPKALLMFCMGFFLFCFRFFLFCFPSCFHGENMLFCFFANEDLKIHFIKYIIHLR